MTKVALVNPGKNKVYGVQEPINLAIIAGYLEENGIKVGYLISLQAMMLKNRF